MSKETRYRVAILVSGGGSNMEALIQAAQRGQLPRVEIALVLSNRAEAGAVERARRHQVPVQVIPSRSRPDEAFQTDILQALNDAHIDIVCLAGYLKKVGQEIVKRYAGRILNIHPALLPKYGGAGMYGHSVHEAVIKACEVESGCTVHLVDDEFDHGDILAQVRVPVQPGDTPEQLAARVLEQEHQLYPRVLAAFTETLARR